MSMVRSFRAASLEEKAVIFSMIMNTVRSFHVAPLDEKAAMVSVAFVYVCVGLVLVHVMWVGLEGPWKGLKYLLGLF